MTNFDVTAFYYNDDQNQYRKYLDIKKKGTSSSLPDLMVIMMNPGSSEHKDITQMHYDREVVAKPDMTQYKIMVVMKNCNLHYARVLNLSDLREKVSSEFCKKIKQLPPIHSIFAIERREELNELFIPDVPIIAGWGVSDKLEKLRNSALEYLGERNLIGYLKDGAENCYYHPLARFKKDASWIDTISDQLKNSL